MIRFREKLFNDAFEEYQNKKQRRINNIVQNSLDEVEKHKENKKNINSSIFNPTPNNGSFKEYKTKYIKSREKSLDKLIIEENKTGKISTNSLLKHGLYYGKKSK